MSRWRKIDFQEVEAEEDQARLLDGYEPVGLVKLDRGRAGPTGRRLERKGLGGSGMGRARAAGYAVTTHARTCSSVARPRTKATLPLAAVRPLHTDGKERAVAGIRALCRAPEFSDAIGDAPRAQWPLAAPPRPPPALGTPLLCLASGLGLSCACACANAAPNKRDCRWPAGQIARDQAIVSTPAQDVARVSVPTQLPPTESHHGRSPQPKAMRNPKPSRCGVTRTSSYSSKLSSAERHLHHLSRSLA